MAAAIEGHTAASLFAAIVSAVLLIVAALMCASRKKDRESSQRQEEEAAVTDAVLELDKILVMDDSSGVVQLNRGLYTGTVTGQMLETADQQMQQKAEQQAQRKEQEELERTKMEAKDQRKVEKVLDKKRKENEERRKRNMEKGQLIEDFATDTLLANVAPGKVDPVLAINARLYKQETRSTMAKVHEMEERKKRAIEEERQRVQEEAQRRAEEEKQRIERENEQRRKRNLEKGAAIERAATDLLLDGVTSTERSLTLNRHLYGEGPTASTILKQQKERERQELEKQRQAAELARAREEEKRARLAREQEERSKRNLEKGQAIEQEANAILNGGGTLDGSDKGKLKLNQRLYKQTSQGTQSIHSHQSDLSQTSGASHGKSTTSPDVNKVAGSEEGA